jgi:hypothetical protein
MITRLIVSVFKLGLVLAAEKFWSLRLKVLQNQAFRDRFEQMSAELNCPIFSHKWDSQNHKERFCAITGFSAMIDHTS